jgi:hypothetical protein
MFGVSCAKTRVDAEACPCCIVSMGDKPDGPKGEELAEALAGSEGAIRDASLVQLIKAMDAAIDALEPTLAAGGKLAAPEGVVAVADQPVAPLSPVDRVVKVLCEFGARPNFNQMVRGRHEDAVFREFAFELNRRVEMRCTRQRLFAEPKRIADWATGGKFQEMAELFALEFETPPGLFTSLRGELAAMGLTLPEFADLFRKVTRAWQAEAERTQAERGDSAAMMKELRKRRRERWPPPPRPRQSVQAHFAKALVELAGKYFDISTALKTELTEDREPRLLKVGPIVTLGGLLAPIWGIEPPSGTAFADAKRQLRR